MQFLPATFAAYDQPVPPGGVTPPSPYDPVDAIYAAARMLCANGARNNADIRAAVFSYNHADGMCQRYWLRRRNTPAHRPAE
jgi:membrane-bound lytic murein transglycosylase B